MRILVTGGAGFIGSNLALHFARAGHEVTVLDSFLTADFHNLIDFPGDVITGDCTIHPDRLAYRFDAVLHQSAITGVVNPAGPHGAAGGLTTAALLQNNLEGFRNVLAWAAMWKAQVVWASSASIYGHGRPPNREADPPQPLNAYAFSKLACERLAERWSKATGLPATGLRYFNVYGPGEAHKGKLASMIYQLAQQMKAGQRPRVFKFGEQKRDFVYIADVVAANERALAVKRSGSYNVGAGQPASFNALVKELNAVLGKTLEPDYFDNPYSFTQDHTEADLKRSRAELGYEPQVQLAAGVRAYQASGRL
jgi:ADP-L-glycero-D-manno-heptose 6-epimerase